MLFVPLPFVIALLIVLLIPRVLAERDESPAPSWFAVLLGLYALLAVLVGLRWGYDLRALLPLQSLLAACWAPLAWLAFAGVGRPGAFFAIRRDWPHLLPPALVGACVGLWPRPIDLLLIGVFGGYGVALLLKWRRGPDAMPAIRLGELADVHRALGLTGLVLIAFTLIDALISLDIRLLGGANAERIVTYASLPMLLLVGYGASVAGVGRASDMPPSPGDGVTDRFTPGRGSIKETVVGKPATGDIAGGTTTLEPAASRRSFDGGTDATDLPAEREHDAAEDRAAFERVREALHRDGLYRDPDLTLERIARRSLVPARRVSGAINRLSGDSVSRYVNRLRLDEVRRRLLETDDGITDVMLAAGFRTKSNFNRTFREVEGCSPSEWRVAHRRGGERAPSE